MKKADYGVITTEIRHSRVGGNPSGVGLRWASACTGMTDLYTYTPRALRGAAADRRLVRIYFEEGLIDEAGDCGAYDGHHPEQP